MSAGGDGAATDLQTPGGTIEDATHNDVNDSLAEPEAAFYVLRDNTRALVATRKNKNACRMEVRHGGASPSGASSGITAIVQPGGSINDYDAIDECNSSSTAMVFSLERCFSHH